MAKYPENWTWSFFGVGSGLGGLLLSARCSGSCGACYGCIGTGVAITAITAVALLRGRPTPPVKGDADGMAARND